MRSIHLCRVLVSVSGLLLVCVGGCGSHPQPSQPAPSVIPTAPTPTTTLSTQPTVLKFNETSIKAIQSGTKTATVRKGYRAFPPGPVRAVGTAGSVVMLDGVTTTTKTVSQLTEDDAKANGSASLEALKTDLAKDYPGIKADDTVTVVRFRLDHAGM